MMTNKRILAAGAVLLAAAALSACGGGSDNGNGGDQAVSPGASDAFFTRMLALIGSIPDNAEPVATGDIAVTTPSDTDPAPL